MKATKSRWKLFNIDIWYWKYNYPMTRSVRRRLGRLVGRSAYFPKRAGSCTSLLLWDHLLSLLYLLKTVKSATQGLKASISYWFLNSWKYFIKLISVQRQFRAANVAQIAELEKRSSRDLLGQGELRWICHLLTLRLLKSFKIPNSLDGTFL